MALHRLQIARDFPLMAQTERTKHTDQSPDPVKAVALSDAVLAAVVAPLKEARILWWKCADNQRSALRRGIYTEYTVHTAVCSGLVVHMT